MRAGPGPADAPFVALSRPSSRTRARVLWTAALVVALLLGRWSREPDSQLAVVWPAAGVTLVWLLSEAGRRARAGTLLAVVLVVTAVNVATGLDAVTALGFGGSNAAHALVGLLALQHLGWDAPRPITAPRDGWVLVCAAACASATSGLLGGALSALRFDGAFAADAALVLARNALSTAVVGAALLALPHLRGAWSARTLARGEGPLLLVAVVASYTAAAALQEGTPVAFLLLPVWVWIGARLAPVCVAVLVSLSSVPLVWQALQGRGAFGALGDPVGRVLVAEGFLAVTALVALGLSISAADRASALAAARTSAEELRRHRDASLVGSAVLDLRLGGVVLSSANPALAGLLRRPAGALEGADWPALLTPSAAAEVAAVLERLRSGADSQWLGELEHVRGDGSTCWAQVALAALDGTPGLLAVQLLDVSERRAAAQALAHQARHDELTGLPRRALLRERLDAALERLHEHGEPFAVVFLDLDRFKDVNDRHGHHAGDQVLVALSRRLGAAVRPQDTVARVGGDEFVVLCPGLSTRDTAEELAQRLVAAAREPLRLTGLDLAVGLSAGVAVARPGDTADGLLRHSDAALRSAKRGGRGRVAVAGALPYARTASP